ncbi:hypothetical protein [Bacteroides sp.]
MKKLILIFLAFFLPLGLYAQYKVKEKSHKETPAWINGTARNYLIISATAPTIEEAKEKILILLRNQVIKAIATNIMSQTSLESIQDNKDENYTYSERMQSSITSKAARIPYIKNISLSKAEDYYWEKLYNKKEKTYFYEYHIKYKLSSLELEMMVKDFNEREKKLNLQLETYRSQLENVNSVEEIDQTLNELKGFINEFDQDDSRREQTNQLMNNYLNLYSNIRLEETDRGEKNITVGLFLGNKQLRCEKKPVLKSACATKFTIQQQKDGAFHIGYDDFNCYEEDDNFIEVRFLLGTTTVSRKCYIK